MIPRPGLVPLSFEPPLRVELRAFVLRPLTAARVRGRLRGLHVERPAPTSDLPHRRPASGRPSDRWPAGTTLASAYIDTAWCEFEFHLRTSFTYVVLERGEARQVGAAYIWPCAKAGFDADCQTWVRADLIGGAADQTVYRLFRAWVEDAWPFELERTAWPGREIPWQESDRLPAKPT
jgi:hypothetical protein